MKKSFNEIINQEVPVLIDFYADWCGPCKSMAPILKQLKSELKQEANLKKLSKNQTTSAWILFTIKLSGKEVIFLKSLFQNYKISLNTISLFIFLLLADKV